MFLLFKNDKYAILCPKILYNIPRVEFRLIDCSVHSAALAISQSIKDWVIFGDYEFKMIMNTHIDVRLCYPTKEIQSILFSEYICPYVPYVERTINFFDFALQFDFVG